MVPIVSHLSSLFNLGFGHVTLSQPLLFNMPPKSATIRQPARRQPVKLKASIQVTTPDELAANLASNLTISSGNLRYDATPHEKEVKRIACMRTINSTSQALNAIVQSGWRASKPEPLTKESSPLALAVEGRTALRELRMVDPGVLNTERAASSLSGKFIALELVSALPYIHLTSCDSSTTAVRRCLKSSGRHARTPTSTI